MLKHSCHSSYLFNAGCLRTFIYLLTWVVNVNAFIVTLHRRLPRGMAKEKITHCIQSLQFSVHIPHYWLSAGSKQARQLSVKQ